MTSMTSLDMGLTVAFSVVVIVNLVGNTVVCLVVFRYHGMRAPVNYLLVNLAASDIMVALFIIPVYVIKWAFHHPSGTAVVGLSAKKVKSSSIKSFTCLLFYRCATKGRSTLN